MASQAQDQHQERETKIYPFVSPYTHYLRTLQLVFIQHELLACIARYFISVLFVRQESLRSKQSTVKRLDGP